LEELDSVREEEVDAGGLLSDLENDSDHRSVENSVDKEMTVSLGQDRRREETKTNRSFIEKHSL
jgi:hypothetical protein